MFVLYRNVQSLLFTQTKYSRKTRFCFGILMKEWVTIEPPTLSENAFTRILAKLEYSKQADSNIQGLKKSCHINLELTVLYRSNSNWSAYYLHFLQ